MVTYLLEGLSELLDSFLILVESAPLFFLLVLFIISVDGASLQLSVPLVLELQGDPLRDWVDRDVLSLSVHLDHIEYP